MRVFELGRILKSLPWLANQPVQILGKQIFLTQIPLRLTHILARFFGQKTNKK